MLSATATKPLPVLVVDDDSALIRTLADILRMHGYDPSTAVTGREGLALAKHQSPALAVVDLRLPDMDGMELASKLHELSELTEVVVLTGNASVESAVAALREHSVDYLLKPVNVEQLLQVASLATERWQRRNAEEKLRESDERFRRVVESDMLGIMFWDADGKIYDANAAFLRMTGYSKHDVEHGELIWAALTPPEYTGLVDVKRAELAAKGVIAPYEREMFTKNGNVVPILMGAATLEGTTDRGVCFVLDITDRKRAERSLEARVRQQAAVANLGRRALTAENLGNLFDDAVGLVAETLDVPLSGVFERRSDGKALVLRAGVGWRGALVGHTMVSSSEATQWGYTLSHNEPAIVTNLAAEQRFSDATLLAASEVASGVTVVIPGPVAAFGVLAAHDRRPHQFSRDDVHFLEAIAHVIGTAVERHRADVAVRQAQRLEAVGRVASGVSHDFNNMLTAITGFAEMVRGNLADSDPMRSDVEEILKAAGRAAGLTRQLLAFSRQQVMQPRTLRLNDVVVDMEKMVRRLTGKDIELVLSLDPNLEWVKADPSQIEQVVLNLCVNARDAMPNGGTLTIETVNANLDGAQTHEHSMESPGEYVMLAVTDTGTGMDPDTKARVFEPFFTTKSPDKGTGLGLATVYGIVKQSSGEIWAYSELGQGSSFKVFLPRFKEMSNAPAGAPSAPAGGTETVLIAEDEDAIRAIAKRILEKAGYTVLIAKNGSDAARVADNYAGAIHLLVTDMVMPVLSGRQLANRLRKRRPDTRVLFLSGYTESTVAREGSLEKGAHFLQKPFAGDSLLRKVREVLDARAHSNGR
jgi:PAS domain S-box-containing protein